MLPDIGKGIGQSMMNNYASTVPFAVIISPKLCQPAQRFPSIGFGIGRMQKTAGKGVTHFR